MKIASIDVDAQKTFTPLCPQELPVPEGDAIAPALNRQAALADFRIMTKDAHCANAVWVVNDHAQMLQPLEYPNADVTWVRHAETGTRGFELLDELPKVTDYDFVIYKGVEPDLHPYGACFHDHAESVSTGLIEWLRQKHVSAVIVGGLALDYCVKTTALQLNAAGFQVYVNREATRGIANETVKQAIDEMIKAGITIVEDAALLSTLLRRVLEE